MSVKSGGGNPLRLAVRACDCGKTQTGGQGDRTGRGREASARSGGEPQLAAGPQGREEAPWHLGSDRSAPAGRPAALPCAAGRETAPAERCLPARRPSGRFPPWSAAPSLCTNLSGRHLLLKSQKVRVRSAEIVCPPEIAYSEPGRLKDAFVSVVVVFSFSFSNWHVTNETCGSRGLRGRLAGEAEPPRPPPPAPARAAQAPRCCRPLGLG